MARQRLWEAEGKQLARRRESRGYTQASLAEAVGVDSRTVGYWEAGETRPRPANRKRLGELLRLPLPSWQDDVRTAYALKGSEQATSISGPTDRRAADVPLQQRNVPEPPVEALDAG